MQDTLTNILFYKKGTGPDKGKMVITLNKLSQGGKKRFKKEEIFSFLAENRIDPSNAVLSGKLINLIDF